MPITDPQLAAFLGLVAYVGEKCEHCGHVYDSVDDIMERRPKWAAGPGEDVKLVDGDCWKAWLKAHPAKIKP